MPSDLVEGEWIVRRESPLGATLEACRKQGASDFHWSPRAESSVRWYGQLLPWKATPLAARSVQEDLVYHLHKREREELDRAGATLSNAWLHDGWRVRFSLFRVPGGQSFTARVFRPDLPTSVEMGIPAGAAVGYDFQGGLFLIAGPQGSGRTTTLHAILRDILNSRPLPAVRILRSIDYEAGPGLGVVTTWRVGRETPHMVDGLRDASALSPRVVVIDDLTTGEECLAALDLAEQGVLVLATIRADSSSMAFGRFVEAVEPDSALFLAQRFCEHIRAILTQRLLPRKDVPGLILVAELLLGTPALANVLRNARPNQIDAALRGGRRQGMIAIDDSLHDLVTRGVLDLEVAKRVTLNRQLLDKTKAGSTGPTASRPPTLPPGPPSSRRY